MTIISMLVLMNSINYDFEISELINEKLKFSELPIEIKEYLIHPPEFDNENLSPLIVIDSIEADRYSVEVNFNKEVRSWVDYTRLIDAQSKTSYRINQGVPDPYIIFNNKLYIPDRFNIFTTVDDINIVEFTCYSLK